MALSKEALNPTYIVSLSSDPIHSETDLTFKDVVEVHRNYYFAAKKDRRGWPHPNTFRFIGFHNIDTLLSVRPVLSYRLVAPKDTPYSKGMTDETHWLLTLGEPIPELSGKALGKVFPKGRKWADLDHLEEAPTVWEACEKSKRFYSKGA